MKKFTLPEGTTNRHQWHKGALATICKVSETFDQRRELWGVLGVDETENLVSIFSFGADDPLNPEAVKLYNNLGDLFDWTITKENASIIAEAFIDILPDAVKTIPIEDNRRTPEVDAEQKAAQLGNRAERDTAEAERVAELAAHAGDVPANAKALIIAEEDIDDCDLMSDYFNVKTGRTIVLGFSTHTRDIFSEMRKHAPHCPEVAHLATRPTVDGNNRPQTADNKDYWHPADEHREKYSMGSGYYLKDGSHYSSGWTIRKISPWRKGENLLERLPAGCEWLLASTAATTATTSSTIHGGTAGATIEEHTHTKHGFQMYLVIPSERLPRETFSVCRSNCSLLGGWYSRQWRQTPGGYAFKQLETAQRFLAENFAGDEIPPPDKPSKPQTDMAPNAAIAKKFRAMADTMQVQIDAKLGDRMTNTPKRQREAASARIDGDRLERTQQALRALADYHESGTVPELLRGYTSKKGIFDDLGTRTCSQGYYHIADTGEATRDTPQAVALWGLITGKSDEQKAAEELAAKIDALQFAQIPGYFPTPADLVEEMIVRADIKAGHSVLEPSAGSGAIVDELADLHADPLIVVHESNHTLCEILQAKGYDARPGDFLQSNGEFRFDRVVMNPPFENLQDIDHVRHAFGKLKDGGRLVSIMSPGPFFRQDKKAQEFRAWFEDLGGVVKDLPAGTFKESGTGVASKLVVIDR